MYHNSSQKKFWIFDKEAKLDQFRQEANQKFHSKALGLRKPGINESMFLEPREEKVLFRHYEKRLLDFCSVFKPVMPKSVVGTACMYFRRFYLNNSLMDYHPRTIMLTCAYLSCKVDEFNVSSTQFVGNLQESPAGQERALEQILEYELLLIQQLNFHLVVHNPYRPLEGFLIDLKTRYPLLENPEMMRKSADDFLNRASMTDVGLLFSPSQIALTAVLNSAARAGLNMETYLTECMGLKEDKETLSKMYDVMRRITTLIKEYELPKVEEVNMCKQKLERIHAEFTTNTNLKRKHGYEDDDHVVKKPLVTEEVSNGFLTPFPSFTHHSFVTAFIIWNLMKGYRV
ncbi:cyclin-H isoform X1 [Electrophorus electricus]|uniref:cyclin-H isoform X1 n=1 Tax=Electrophorus electricus TaxID=8005 RepID=UPI0015D08BB8|nr:cyclin-H isoform X1 [Electrophorus electricus]XP_026858640.2 cyclin-H isoform X1 [Electrophorus electricus]XP_026858641.2 cyclin-H isoform X1 [Electrophorus electricus]XP_035385521.1 cyclin-H isoform X1 [Electrophorus electricus]